MLYLGLIYVIKRNKVQVTNEREFALGKCTNALKSISPAKYNLFLKKSPWKKNVRHIKSALKVFIQK